MWIQRGPQIIERSHITRVLGAREGWFGGAYHADTGELPGNSSVCPAVRGLTHQVSTVSLHQKPEKFVWHFGCCTSTEYGGSIVLAVALSEDWGEGIAHSIASKKKLFRFSVQLWIICQIYTPDSAINSLRSPLRGVYVMYGRMRCLWSAHTL